MLDFPEELVVAAPTPSGVAAALGIADDAVEWFGKNRMDWYVLKLDGLGCAHAKTRHTNAHTCTPYTQKHLCNY